MAKDKETPNPKYNDNNAIRAWGYPSTYSVLPGDALRLHVMSKQKNARIRVYPLTQYNGSGFSGTPLVDRDSVRIDDDLQSPNLTGTDWGIDDWNWPQNVDVPIPSNCASGIYVAEIIAMAGSSPQTVGVSNWVMFVVKNPNPSAPILYKFDINTVGAYNLGTHDFVIPSNNPNGIASFNNDFYANFASGTSSTMPMKVTLRRPVTAYVWGVKSVLNDYPLVLWMQQQGYSADFCTDIDVHLDSNLAMLSNYAHVVSPGHDEYWSREMFDNLTNYRNRGGNISFLSGNTCCWEVHMTDVDPAFGVPTAFTTDKGSNTQDVNGPDAWWKVAGGPENRLLGTGTRHAGIRGEVPTEPFAATTPSSPGFRMQNTHHWVLANSGIGQGQFIGVGDLHDQNGAPLVEALIGHEENGARVTIDGNGEATPTYDDGTPRNFVVLGVAETKPVNWAGGSRAPDAWAVFSREGADGMADSGPYAATMGFYSAYGSVFAGSTVRYGVTLNSWDADAGGSRNIPREWSGLTSPPTDADGKPILGNPHLHRITRNVFDAFQDRARSVVAVGDLNGDGVADLVLQTDRTGEPSYWLLNGTTRNAAGSILDPIGSAGPRLRIVGVGSFTAQHGRDLLLQDQVDSHLEIAPLGVDSDGAISRGASRLLIDTFKDPDFKVVAVLDLDGDGWSDLLFQNQTDGSLFYWTLDKEKQTGFADFVPDYKPGNLDFRVVAALDLDGDGQDDLLFQNQNDGSLFYWLRDGLSQKKDGEGTPLTGVLPVSLNDASWKVVGAGSLHQDGSRTIVYQHASTGDLQHITVSGLAETGSGTFAPSSNPWFL